MSKASNTKRFKLLIRLQNKILFLSLSSNDRVMDIGGHANTCMLMLKEMSHKIGQINFSDKNLVRNKMHCSMNDIILLSVCRAI